MSIAASGAAKGAKKGTGAGSSASVSAPSGRREEEIVEKSLNDICRRLWHALPTVAATASETPPVVEADGGATDGVQAVDPRDELSVPHAEMRTAVLCLYMATHSNPTPEDVEAAVAAVVGPDDAPRQPMYTQPDVFEFLRALPARWLPDYEPTRAAATRGASELTERATKLLLQELIECVTQDDPPHALLPAEEVLMLSNHHAAIPPLPNAVVLRTPVSHFVPMTDHRSYPEVFDRLWGLSSDGEVPPMLAGVLSADCFARAVTWFCVLHFCNATEARSRVAAETLFYECLSERGVMDMDSFQRACVRLCQRYAQRRDTAACLSELLERTAAAQGIAVTEMVSLRLTPEALDALDAQHPRALLDDPETLYLPDELHPTSHEVEALLAGPTANRIVVYGDRCAGTSAVGRALADTLRCHHFDVLELAVEAAQRASAVAAEGRPDAVDAVDAEVLACVEALRPVPLSLQATLVRRALDTVAPSLPFRGFVLSDVPHGADGLDEFVRASGLAGEAVVPAGFLRLSHATAAVAQELLAAETSRAAVAVARARRSEEARAMRASCAEIIEHAAALQADPATPAVELALARQQAAEAREIVAQLDAERAEEVQAAGLPADPAAAAGDEDEDGGAAAERALAVAQQARESERKDRVTLLRQLIADGRAAGAEVTLAPAPMVLAECAPSWAGCLAGAQLLGRALSVDAASTVADTVAYVTQACGLQPTVLPFLPATVASDGEADADTAARFTEAVAAGDEAEAGRLSEAAAAEKAAGLSPVWKRACPVTYAEDGVLVDGAACFLCVYRGYQYWTTSRERLARFMANPPAYLRPDRRPVSDRQRVLLIADESVREGLPSTEALLASPVVMDLAEQLQLTTFTLSDYARHVAAYVELRDRRAAVLAARREHDAREWQLRDERQEKRAKAEAKKRKATTNATKAKGKRASAMPAAAAAGAGADAKMTDTTTAAVVAAKLPEEIVPTPTEKALERAIADARERLESAVPVLVVLPAWAVADDAGLQAELDALLTERCLPETVVVLEAPRRAVEESSEAAAEAEAEAEAEPSTGPTAALLAKIAAAAAANGTARTGAAASWKRKEGDSITLSPQTFTTHTVTYADEDVPATLRRVLQLVCPAAPPVGEGIVDEELGQDDEEEEEDEEEGMDGEDGEDTSGMEGGDGGGGGGAARPPGADPPVVRPDPRLRPGRRFLHQFGSRLEYCPVTLLEQRLLVRGRPELCLSFQQGLYCFASEAYRDMFARDPLRYTAATPPRDVPPRLWIVGASLTGKRTLAAGLAATYGVHAFHFSRPFLERCIEAAQKPGGGVVDGIRIPAHPATHPHVTRAAAELKAVREFAEDQTRRAKLRTEAEATMAAREQREEERAANGDDGDDEDASGEDVLDEAREAELQEQLEFEPEDPEEAQERLTRAYLRMASCVTRFEPFESAGYVMTTPPFSEADLEILWEQACIPEAVLHLDLKPEVYEQRQAAVAEAAAAAQRAAEAAKAAAGTSAAAGAAERQRAARREAAEQRAREHALHRWRRRHIGANDPDPVEPATAGGDGGEEETGAGGAGGAEEPSTRPGDGEGEGGEGAEASRADQLEALEAFLATVEERHVPIFRPNANVERDAVLRAAAAALARHLDHRRSFFYSAEVVAYDTAVALLQDGRADLSMYGHTDPVALHRGRAGARRTCAWSTEADDDVAAAFVREEEEVVADAALAPTGGDGATTEGGEDAGGETPGGGGGEEEEELSEMDPDELEERRARLERRRDRERKARALRCARLCGRLYFFADDANLLAFIEDPLPYAEQPPPFPALARHVPVVSIFTSDGLHVDCTATSPFTPTTTTATAVGVPLHAPAAASRAPVPLAQAVAENLGALLVTVPSLIAWAAGLPGRLPSLAARALQAAMEGAADDALVSELLLARMRSAEAKRRGVVLLNLPRTVAQVGALASAASECAPVSAAVVMADAAPWCTAVADAIRSHATVAPPLPVPMPSTTHSFANLLSIVHAVDEAHAAERVRLLRTRLGFPMQCAGTYHGTAAVDAGLSPYDAYCPYRWVEDGDLVRVDRASPALCAGVYLGRYYLLSEPRFLARFLLRPQEVAEAPAARPLPHPLPEPVSAVGEVPLALKGCCPVLLYDTRDRRGLRGVVEPLARVGSMECLVAYNGACYACADEASRQRFLQRPWQYVDGAVLPSARRCPLTDNGDAGEEAEAARAVGNEEFMRRELYDAVARAMVAVADARPRYPGLSDEASALKFMALHMKAHHERSDALRKEQYGENYAVFARRSTMYKSLTTPGAAVGAAPADQVRAAGVEDLCAEYEALSKGEKGVAHLGHLRCPSDQQL